MEYLIKDEKCDLAYTDSILNGWKNYFIELLNGHGVKVARWTERHTAEPLMPVASVSEVEMAIEKLEKKKMSPDIKFSWN